MKVVSPYEELKSWFSLENYEQLKSLTIKELHTELAFREGANKQVISSQADSLIKISRIWADF
ncbi:DUF6387 family protein, partial [Escherichia coli]|uniref:DUF6387 family protein n=1 Tax=Escherichia coli TaxID=562 RepID=UPI00202323DD